MNDLQIVINETPAVINDNFAEVKDNLANMMQAYEGLTYTDETVSVGRKDIAILRKIRKALEDKRKEVKKSHMIPYEEFEAKAKELIQIIDDAINPLEKQIDDYAERKRQERKTSILEYFNAAVGDIDCLSFDDVYQLAWISNMSTSMKSIKSEIDKRIESVKQDLESINAFGSEVEEKALKAYKASKKLSDAVKIINDYEQQKREILAREEARKKAEEERRRQEEERKIREEELRKQREETARRVEEERKQREEAARVEREKQEAIEKARDEERARFQCELAEKAHREERTFIEPEDPFGVSGPFDHAESEETTNPFGHTESDENQPDPFKQGEQEESNKLVEQVTGEVESVATSQQRLRNVMIRFRATDSQVRDIEKYLLSINVSFIKQVM